VNSKLLSSAMGWFCCLLCLAVLVPNHYQPWLGFHQEWLAVIALLPVAVWALCQQYCSPPSAISWMTVAALLGSTIALFQLATGRIYFLSDSLMAMLYWLLLAVSALVGQRLIAHENTLRSPEARLQPFWWAWVAAGLVSWAMALHQWLDSPYFGLFIIDMPPGGRPFANLAQPNHLATVLLLSITGTLFLRETRQLGRITTGALLVVFCFALAMTQSRHVILGLGLWCLVFHGMRSRHGLTLPKWTHVAVVTLYVVCTLAWPKINDLLLLMDNAQSALQRSEAGVRPIYWASALEAISMRPWVGWGFGQIGLAQQATALNYPATYTFFSSAHNFALDLMLWMGVPATLLFCFFLYKHVADSIKLPPTKAQWASWSGLACILGHALVELPLVYSYFLIPAGFMLGSIVRIDSGLAVARSWKNIRRFLIVLGGIISIVLLFKLTTEYWYWEEDWRNARFQMLRYEGATQEAEPEWIVLDQIAAMHHAARHKPERNMLESELEAYKKNAERFPSSLALLRYAYAAGLNGRPEAATHSLQILCSLHKPAVCNAARKEWAAASKNEWPELDLINFPDASSFSK
jgi:O-antigen ligase